jgi:hypothetical protein
MKEDRKDLKPIYLNYKRNNKWLGIIDYKSLCIVIGYTVIIGYFVSLLSIDISFKLYLFIALTVPFIGIVVININSDNTIGMIKTMLRFVISPKKYVLFENGLTAKDIKKFKGQKYINNNK